MEKAPDEGSLVRLAGLTGRLVRCWVQEVHQWRRIRFPVCRLIGDAAGVPGCPADGITALACLVHRESVAHHLRQDVVRKRQTASIAHQAVPFVRRGERRRAGDWGDV